MESGKLDQRVILQSLTETRNDFGEVVMSYTTAATVWARVVSEKGNEAFESARVNARAKIRVAIRYRNDVTVKWRVQWNSDTYNILYIDDTLRRDGELWLTCEVTDAG